LTRQRLEFGVCVFASPTDGVSVWQESGLATPMKPPMDRHTDRVQDFAVAEANAFGPIATALM